VSDLIIIRPTTHFSSVAEAQYDELVHSPDAWQFVDDGAQSEEDYRSQFDIRPTNSARRVKTLVDQITDRYKPLPRFSHRARFLIAVQIPILEHYHTRISGSLDAFETLSSSLMRVVPGALAGQAGHQYDTRRLTSGVDGLQRLIKAFVSARWVTIAMQDWGEQLVCFMSPFQLSLMNLVLSRTLERNQ
jgi:RAD50-interacting protein 1